MLYFASKPTNEIAKELCSRVERYDEYLQTSGLMNELKRSYKAYYGNSQIGTTGVQGELQTMEVNHYASLIRAILTMVTSQRPAWECRASNSDTKSQSQTILGSGLLDYYMREKRLERHLKEAVQSALFLREAFLSVTWNATGGEVYAVNPESGAPIMEGDIEYRVFKLNDVIRDVARQDSNFEWLIVRKYVNKHDLAAKYPEHAEKILAIESSNHSFEDLNRFRGIDVERFESDEIAYYTFYHHKSDALPNGRQVDFLTDNIVLFDGTLPYRRVPLYRITAEDALETAFGHSPALDLLPLQDALNTVFSTVLTNQAAFGVQNVLIPKGSNISVNQVTGGMNIIEYDKNLGVPQPLNLTNTPPEVFNFIELLERHAQTISGVNSVARGNAPASLSGAAMALLQSTALQFSSGVQQSFTQLVEDAGTATIHLLADFATTKRVAHIVGRHNKAMLREFSGEDVSSISRVTVDSANALTKTIAGRTEIANQLLNSGMIQRPEQYLMVLQTGQLEPIYENETSELILIRAENEELSEGKFAPVMALDNHQLHILEHKAVISSLDARRNPAIVKAASDHIQAHLDQLRTVDPMLLGLVGQQAVPPVNQAPQGVPAVQNSMNPVAQQAEAVQTPNLPVNPLTGSRIE